MTDQEFLECLGKIQIYIFLLALTENFPGMMLACRSWDNLLATWLVTSSRGETRALLGVPKFNRYFKMELPSSHQGELEGSR